MNNRIGLAVMRIQPLHSGHTKIINRMIQDCATAIVCLGSAQKSRERHDPWTVEERMLMLRNVYGDRIKIIPLNDLNAVHPNQWVGYIFDKIAKLGMKEPTDYYTGSIQDSLWYKEHFWAGSFTDQIPETYYTKEKIVRKLHIGHRDIDPIPSATEIRGFLELRNNGWENWTPAVNHDIISTTYPEEFKIPPS